LALFGLQGTGRSYHPSVAPARSRLPALQEVTNPRTPPAVRIPVKVPQEPEQALRDFTLACPSRFGIERLEYLHVGKRVQGWPLIIIGEWVMRIEIERSKKHLHDSRSNCKPSTGDDRDAARVAVAQILLPPYSMKHFIDTPAREPQLIAAVPDGLSPRNLPDTEFERRFALSILLEKNL
jgi:hypothetical protein